MTICFIYWDDVSYQLLNNSSSFSIQAVPATAYKIIWDEGGGGGKEHIINNPNNYNINLFWGWYAKTKTKRSYINCSYPISINETYWVSDSASTAGYGGGNAGNNGATPLTWQPVNPPNSNVDVVESSVWLSAQKNGFDDGCGNWLYNVYYRRNGIIDNSDWFGYQVDNNLLFAFDKRIRITDNGINFFYNISDKNSVQTIYNTGYNEIVIEGNHFKIIDTNSAYKLCDNECPPGTCKIECFDHYCCYDSSGKSVKTISK